MEQIVTPEQRKFNEHKQKAIREFNDWYSTIQLQTKSNPKIIRTCIEHILYSMVIKKFGITKFDSGTLKSLKSRSFPPGILTFNASACLHLLQEGKALPDQYVQIASDLIKSGNKDIHDVIEQNPDNNSFIQLVDWFFIKTCEESNWRILHVGKAMELLKRNMLSEIGRAMRDVDSKDSSISKASPYLLDSYIHLNFWDDYEIGNGINELKYFYTHPAYSNEEMLKRVVASGSYIQPNSDLKIIELSKSQRPFENLEEILPELEEKHNLKCLIKVTGLGGSGKTTFLWHLAYKYHKRYKTFFLKSLNHESIQSISQVVGTDEVALILFDSIYSEGGTESKLKSFFSILNNLPKVVFVVAERDSWLKYFERTFSLSRYFIDVFEIPFTNCLDKERVLSKLLEILNVELKAELRIEDFKDLIKADSSLVVSKYRLLKKVKEKVLAFEFTFDWQDWEKFTTDDNKFSSLKYLYLFISAFQHLGQKVPARLNFNDVLKGKDVDYILINEAIKKISSKILAIESIGSGVVTEFIQSYDDQVCEILISELSSEDKRILGELLDNYFSSINDKASIYLFRNIHRKDTFKKSELFEPFLTPQKRIQILEVYLKSVPSEKDYTSNELKCMTELIKTYEEVVRKGEKVEAAYNQERMLEAINKLIRIEEGLKGGKSKFGKHMLANCIITFEVIERYKEAELILNSFGEDGYALSSLRKLYEKFKPEDVPDDFRNRKESGLLASEGIEIEMIKAQSYLDDGDIESAIEVYKKIIDNHPKDVQSRTKLSSVLRKKSNGLPTIEGRRFLNEAKNELMIALKLNPKNEHTYTELGEVFLSLGNLDEAIKHLKAGISECKRSYACKTTLGKVFRHKSRQIADEKEFAVIEGLLLDSYRILKKSIEERASTGNNTQPSSIELAETCMELFVRYKGLNPSQVSRAEKYKAEIVTSLTPLFLDDEGKLKHGIKDEYGLKLLLRFYNENDFGDEYDALAIEVLGATYPGFDFWFEMVDAFKSHDNYMKLFTNIIKADIDDKKIYKLVNKLTNKNYDFGNIEVSLAAAIGEAKGDSISYRNGTLLLSSYLYALGNIEKCKNIIIGYAKANPSKSKSIWIEFLTLISEHWFHINLEKKYEAELSNPEFYFLKTKEIYSTLIGIFRSKTDSEKHEVNKRFSLAFIMALNKVHLNIFGYNCFYIHLIIGELNKNFFPEIDEKRRLRNARLNFEAAYKLGKQEKFSFLKPEYPYDHTLGQLNFNYFGRLVNNMIDCYLALHRNDDNELSIERAHQIARHSSIERDIPLQCFLQSKLLTREKKYDLAYNVCKRGIQEFDKKPTNNPEMLKGRPMDGFLYANLAYSAHKNLIENKVELYGNKKQSIIAIYKHSLSLMYITEFPSGKKVYSPEKWVQFRLNELEKDEG